MIDHVSLAEVKAHGITVRDPDGHVVHHGDRRCPAQADLIGLARKLWFGKGTVTLRIDHARLERAEVYLLSGAEERRAEHRGRVHAAAQQHPERPARRARRDKLKVVATGDRGRATSTAASPSAACRLWRRS